jgi:hypothetical protein
LPRLLAFGLVFALTAVDAAAQDLFELEVLGYDTASAGHYDVELHELELSAGHCVTRHEPWVMKSVIGYVF